MRTRKRLIKDRVVPIYQLDSSNEARQIWSDIFRFISVVAYAANNPDNARLYGIDTYIRNFKKISQNFKDREIRMAEERRLISLTLRLTELYASFKKNKTPVAQQEIEIERALSGFKATLGIQKSDFLKLTVSTFKDDEEIRGPRDIAALKVANLFKLSKASIYSFRGRLENQPKLSENFLDIIDMHEMLELILTNIMGFDPIGAKKASKLALKYKWTSRKKA